MVQSSSPGYLDPQRFPVVADDPESQEYNDNDNDNNNKNTSTNRENSSNIPPNSSSFLATASGTGLEQIDYTDNTMHDSLHTPVNQISSLSSSSSSSSSTTASIRRSNPQSSMSRNRSLSPSTNQYDYNTTANPHPSLSSSSSSSSSSYIHNESDNDRHSLLGINTNNTNGDGYNPEHASDPVGMALQAIAHAEQGYRPCRWCTVAQPPRAHHCKECNKCVALFDHHCNVINTCIGERNRFRFWFFLGCESTAIATAIGILNTAFVWRRGMGDWIGTNSLALISLIILWLTQLYVLGLFVFHTWLAFTNTTTYETTVGANKLWYLAGTEPKDCDLPFSKGTCYNLRLFCCTLDRCCSKCGWKSLWTGNRSTVTTTVNRTTENSNNSNSNDPRSIPSSFSRPDTYEEEGWIPHEWERAKKIDRESTDICRNIWENRFYSCC